MRQLVIKNIYNSDKQLEQQNQYYKEFKLVSESNNKNTICIYSDHRIQEVQYSSYKYNVGLLVQPEVVLPHIYSRLHIFYKYFNIILTTHLKLVDNIKIFWYPYGTSYLPTKFHSLYQSNKVQNISMVVSELNNTIGHKLRHEVANLFKSKIDGLYGPKYKPLGDPDGSRVGYFKIKALKNYRYNIAIQNSQQDGWFTQKLIDCFITGTIPIYWGGRLDGCTDFNLDGIIQFKTPQQLQQKITICSEEHYNSKIDIIGYNFEKSKKYLYPMNWIYEKYLMDVTCK